jgi:hypothetical protein
MHTYIVFCDGISYPNDMILTPARLADETQLDYVIVLDKNILHIFDRSYFNLHKFDLYCENAIRFVTRIKNNTVVHVT